MSKHCRDTEFILKSDDDQAIDTIHLKKNFVPKFIDTKDPFLLCNLIQDGVPKRNPDSKWFVTRKEYPHDSYPPYCAGWAYVTNIAQVDAILGNLDRNTQKYFWIDDVFVTGILRRGIQVNLYQWDLAFLNSHSQHEDEVI